MNLRHIRHRREAMPNRFGRTASSAAGPAALLMAAAIDAMPRAIPGTLYRRRSVLHNRIIV